MRLRRLSTSLASWKTDASASMVIEVSTILGGGAFSLEGPANIGLEGCASATGGDRGGVGSLSDSTRMLTLGVGEIDGISRRAGQTSSVPSLDLAARLTCNAIATITSIIETCIIFAPSLWGFCATSLQGFLVAIHF